MSAGVELDRLSVRFGNFIAVRNASLNIAGGEFFSFLGPSGCGKTTILRTISGFLDPSEGAVRIGGRDMAGGGADKRPTPPLFLKPPPLPPLRGAPENTHWLRGRGGAQQQRKKRGGGA